MTEKGPAPSAAKKTTATSSTAPRREETLLEPKIQYTRELKKVQKMEEQLSKAAHRVSKATEKGFATYLEVREQSARNKEDGALVDAFINGAKAYSEAVEMASPAMYDVAKAINSLGSTRKQRRRFVKRLRRLRRMSPFFV